MHVQQQVTAINMQHTFKQQCVHDYPGRIHINNPAKLVTGSETASTYISYAHNRWFYLCICTQSHKFNISSPNRYPCVAISQRIMYNVSLCCFIVKKLCLSSFFQ